MTRLTTSRLLGHADRGSIASSCAGCPADIVYSGGERRRLSGDLSRCCRRRRRRARLATRYLGSTTAFGRERIYFDQLEQRRNTGLYSDLYALSRADGRVRRLTSEARLLDPDLVAGRRDAGLRAEPFARTSGISCWSG